MPAHTTTRAALALAAALMATGPATAQDAFPDKDACLQRAFELAGSAETKGLPDDKLAAIDALLETFEGQCESGDLKAAAATAKQIEDQIGG